MLDLFEWYAKSFFFVALEMLKGRYFSYAENNIARYIAREVRRRDWLAPLKWLNPTLENPVDIIAAKKRSRERSKSARMKVLWSVHDQQCNFADVGTRGGSLASSRGYLEIADNGQPPTQPTQNHHTSPMCSKYTDQSLLSFCSVSTIVLHEYTGISRPLHIIPVIQFPIKYLFSLFFFLFLSCSDTIQYRLRNG